LRVAGLAEVACALGLELPGQILGEGQQRHQPAIRVPVCAVVPFAVQQAAVAGVMAADDRWWRGTAGDCPADRALDRPQVVRMGESPFVGALAEHLRRRPAEYPLRLR